MTVQSKQPYKISLPVERLSFFSPPFLFCGVDCFGPISIKFKKHTRAASRNAKRYGALFTCMSTRAMHLEFAGDRSRESFIQTLKHLISRRGSPKQMRSDNGANFVSAEREIKRFETTGSTKIYHRTKRDEHGMDI